MAVIARKLLLSSGSSSSTLFYSSLISIKSAHLNSKLSNPSRVLLGFNFNPFSSFSSATSGRDSNSTGSTENDDVFSMSDAKLLEKLRMRRLKGAAKARETNKTSPGPSTTRASASQKDGERRGSKKEQEEESRRAEPRSGFRKLGLSEEMMRAVGSTDMTIPTEIQFVGIPAILEGKSVLLSSAPETGKTLAYLFPLIQVSFRYLLLNLMNGMRIFNE